MAKNHRQIREKLFQLYSRNLSIHEPRYRDVFGCPICRRLFPREAQNDPPDLSVAHVYPEAAGGKLETLTCADCNNQMGTKYDSHVVNQVRSARDFSEGKFFARMSFEGASGDLGVGVSISGQHTDVKVSGKHSNQRVVDELKSHMIPGEGASFKLTASLGFAPKKLEVGLWHTAFLMMFREFGYEFAMSTMAERMRSVLLGDPYEVEPFFVESTVPNGVSCNWLVNSISILRSPPEHKCFVIGLPPLTNADTGRCIHIAGLDSASWIAHKAMVNQKTVIEQTLDQISVNREIRLPRRAFRGYLRGCWLGRDVDQIIHSEFMGVVAELGGIPPVRVDIAAIADAMGLTPDHMMAVANLLMSSGWLSGDLSANSSPSVQLTEKALSKLQRQPSEPNSCSQENQCEKGGHHR